MTKQIIDVLDKISEQKLDDVELLALVTDTSYEVVFYASHKGVRKQSYALAETGVITPLFADKISAEVAKAVRNDKKYNATKMNIVKGSDDEVTVEYADKDCNAYRIIKQWKKEIGA